MARKKKKQRKIYRAGRPFKSASKRLRDTAGFVVDVGVSQVMIGTAKGLV